MRVECLSIGPAENRRAFSLVNAGNSSILKPPPGATGVKPGTNEGVAVLRGPQGLSLHQGLSSSILPAEESL